MGRATTKDDLISSSKENFTKLWDLIDSMSDEKQNENFAFEDRDKNVKYMLVHLYEWHNLLLNWVFSNQSGDTKPFLPTPYNWRTYPLMNVEFWEKHQSTKLGESKKMLKESHEKVMDLIDKFSNEELFSKKVYSWTGTTTLGSYCVSATGSHYDWAIKRLKNHIKTNSYKKN